MIWAFFLVAIALAFWGMSKKKNIRTQAKEIYQQLQGRSPEDPYIVHRKADITQTVKKERCHCGKHIVQRSFGQAMNHPEIQVAGCECVDMNCDAKIQLYFRIEYLN